MDYNDDFINIELIKLIHFTYILNEFLDFMYGISAIEVKTQVSGKGHTTLKVRPPFFIHIYVYMPDNQAKIMQ